MKTKCWKCGKEIEFTVAENRQVYSDYKFVREFDEDGLSDFKHYPNNYILKGLEECDYPFIRTYCEECEASIREKNKNMLKEYLHLKNELMIDRAIRIFEKQLVDIYDYKEAIDAVSEFAREKPLHFGSADEILAAIILIHNEIKIKTQYKIGKYYVDFLIPDWKCVLEIDGIHHKMKKKADLNRDIDIMNELGPGWDIVRINTKKQKICAFCRRFYISRGKIHSS